MAMPPWLSALRSPISPIGPQRAPRPAGGGAGYGRSGGASTTENLAKADFGQVTGSDELDRLHDLAERWAERIRTRLSRRCRAAREGGRIALRRTFQRSVSSGGAPLRLYRAKRKPKPAKIAVFADVSGSMDLYSLFFTRFVYALSVNLGKNRSLRLPYKAGTYNRYVRLKPIP